MPSTQRLLRSTTTTLTRSPRGSNNLGPRHPLTVFREKAATDPLAALGVPADMRPYSDALAQLPARRGGAYDAVPFLRLP
jgi:hypothetical protein